MAKAPRLTSEEKRGLTFRELLTLEGSQKPSVASEVTSHIKRLEGMVDSRSGTPILDMKVKDMDVGQVIGELISDSPFRDNDVKSTSYRSHSSSLITRMNTMWSAAGYGQGYVKNEIESYLTPDVFTKESGWNFLRARKTPLGFAGDTYQNLKGILADESVPKQSRLQLGAYLFGGFRPENLGSFKIENYDREGGTLTFYDAKSKKNKVVVLNPVAQEFMNQSIGDRTAGPIFMDKDKVQKELNVLLTERMGTVGFRKPDGSVRKENFTVYKLRNLNETLLTDTGLTSGDIDFLNGRKSATEAEGYVAEAARKRRIDNAAKKMTGMIVGYSGTPSVSQFSADIGIPFSEKTRQIAVTSDILVDENYLDALSDDFKQSLPGEFGTYEKAAIPPADPQLAEQYKQEQLAQSQQRSAEAQKAAAIAEKEALELQNSPEMQALRAKSAEGKQQIADQLLEETKEPVTLSPEVKARAKSASERLRQLKKKPPRGTGGVLGTLGVGLGALGLAGVASEAKAAYSEEMESTGSTLRATAAGTLRGAYELFEPAPMGFMRPQPVGEGSDVVPTDESGQPRYRFIEELEAKRREEEGMLGEMQADIEVTYPNEEDNNEIR